MVRNLIAIQDSYINTYHPDFMGGANSIVNVFDVNSYQKEKLSMEALRRNRENSFEDIGADGKIESKKGQA